MFALPGRLRVLIASVAVAAIVLSAGLTWHFTTNDNDDESTPNGRSFYLEYTIERRPDDPAHMPPGAPNLPAAVTGHWWYQAPDKSRYEWRYSDPLLGDSEAISASDGQLGTRYEWTTNTYASTPVDPPGRHPMGSGPISPTWASIPVGPLGFASVDEALQRLARGANVTRDREEALLGRKTEVYVIEHTAPPPVEGLPVRVRETYWIEPEPLAILKGIAESSDGGRITVTATKLEYLRSIDAAKFTVKQPNGSLDVSSTPQISSSVMGESVVPPPFLTATFLPEGFRWSSSSGAPELSHMQEFRSEGTGYLRIEQRYRHGGWPQNRPIPGTKMLYAAGDVWLMRSAGPLVVLHMRGDIIVRVDAEGISYEQAVGVLFGLR
jgi:hypothetical protein